MNEKYYFLIKKSGAIGLLDIKFPTALCILLIKYILFGKYLRTFHIFCHKSSIKFFSNIIVTSIWDMDIIPCKKAKIGFVIKNIYERAKLPEWWLINSSN